MLQSSQKKIAQLHHQLQQNEERIIAFTEKAKEFQIAIKYGVEVDLRKTPASKESVYMAPGLEEDPVMGPQPAA